MAQQMYCDLCGVNPAQVLVTVIETGDAHAIDANCLADFCLAYVKNVAPELLTPPAPKPRRKSAAKPATPMAAHENGDTQHGMEKAEASE